MFGREAYAGLESEARINSDQLGKIKTAYELFSLLGMITEANEEKENEILDAIDAGAVIEKHIIENQQVVVETTESVDDEEEPVVSNKSDYVANRVMSIAAARSVASVGQNKQADNMLKKNRKAINGFKVGGN